MKKPNVRLYNTRRPFSERASLAVDRGLGAGNFFWRSYRRLGDRDTTLFVTEGGRSYSPKDMARQVAALMAHYSDNGVVEDMHVGVRSSDGITGFAHHVALTSLGAVAVHCNSAMPTAQAQAYFTAAGAKVVYADDPIRGWDHLSPLLEDPPDVREIPDPRFDPDHLIMISHSSGTTGTPKTPMFTHGGFWVGKRKRLFTFPQGRGDRLLTCLPHSHSAGLSYMTTALLTGTPLYVHNPISSQTLEDVMSDFRPTGVLSFPSTFADLDPSLITAEALQTVRFWNGMGDASHAGHIRRLLHATPQATYIDGLGSSEMGMVLFQTLKAVSSPATRIVGPPVGVVSDVAVFDENGQRLPKGSPGRLGVQTPSATPGYYGNPELSRSSCVGEYFLTGDIALETASGAWEHLDRVSDVISTEQGPIYSTLMEELLHDVADLQDCAVVGIRSSTGVVRPVIIAVPRSPRTTSARSLYELAERDLGAKDPRTAAPAAVILLEDITHFPRGVTGKALKSQLRETFSDCLRSKSMDRVEGVIDAYHP